MQTQAAALPHKPPLRPVFHGKHSPLWALPDSSPPWYTVFHVVQLPFMGGARPRLLNFYALICTFIQQTTAAEQLTLTILLGFSLTAILPPTILPSAAQSLRAAAPSLGLFYFKPPF